MREAAGYSVYDKANDPGGPPTRAVASFFEEADARRFVVLCREFGDPAWGDLGIAADLEPGGGSGPIASGTPAGLFLHDPEAADEPTRRAVAKAQLLAFGCLQDDTEDLYDEDELLAEVNVEAGYDVREHHRQAWAAFWAEQASPRARAASRAHVEARARWDRPTLIGRWP